MADQTATKSETQQPAQPAKQGTTLAKPPGQTLVGTFRDAAAITARLQSAAQRYHLVSPSTSCGALPEGCSIAITTVTVDPDVEGYDVGFGNIGLAKSALDKIAAAAGVTWDAYLSGRLDDCSDPHYCAWRSVGDYKKFDGSRIRIIGSKEMDLRQGSPQLTALHQRAAKKNKSADDQIREMRLHIMAHAETKARLRAIRSLGLRSSYKREEFARPFVIVSLFWSGETSDPELRRAFALRQQEEMMGSRRDLYGDAPTQAPLLPASPRTAPPPVGTVRDDEDAYIGESVGDIEAPPAKAPPAKQAAAAPRESNGGPTMRFGNAKGEPLSEAGDQDLDWYRDAIAKSVTDPKKSKYRAENIAHLAEIDAELAKRRGEVVEGEQGGLLDGEEEFPT